MYTVYSHPPMQVLVTKNNVWKIETENQVRRNDFESGCARSEEKKLMIGGGGGGGADSDTFFFGLQIFSTFIFHTCIGVVLHARPLW